MKREEILKILHKYNLGSNDMMHLIMPKDIELIADEILSLSPVDKGEAELTDEDLANASKSVLSQCCKIRCKLIPDLVTATDLQYNAFQKFEMPNPDLDQKWRFCPICGTEWTKDCEQFGCWSCGKYNTLRKVEMPSDKQIITEANDEDMPVVDGKATFKYAYDDDQADAFITGARWAIEQIKHLNKLT